MSVKRNKELFEAGSDREYIRLLQSRVKELSMSFQECLEVLAEEQKVSRKTRLKYEKLYKEKEDLKATEAIDKENKLFKGNRQDLVNILRPIAKPARCVPTPEQDIKFTLRQEPNLGHQVESKYITKTVIYTSEPEWRNSVTLDIKPEVEEIKAMPRKSRVSIYIPSRAYGKHAVVTSAPNAVAHPLTNLLPPYARDLSHQYTTIKSVHNHTAKAYLKAILGSHP